MFRCSYSFAFMLVMCLAPIRAPDPTRDSVRFADFDTWRSGDICNDTNKGRVPNLCLKLSGTKDSFVAQSIRTESGCEKKWMKLIKDGKNGHFEKTVGFCQMGTDNSQMKCITKSEGSDDMLVWDWEGSLGQEYCAPKYEKTGWLAPGAEFQ